MRKEINKEIIEQWRHEEEIAHVHGWDFSHIHGRYEEEQDLPWDYRNLVLSYLTAEQKILDIDTGGGEFLLSLPHPYEKLSATEAYPPNEALCKKTLLPLGIDVKEADAQGKLPFADRCFDMVLNRHGQLNIREIYRVLKPGGYVITQQVGAKNDRGLIDLLYAQTPPPCACDKYAALEKERFESAGFRVLRAQEAFRPIKFYDVGALVWFAHIIEWEFPDFSIERNFEGLCKAQELLEENGCVEASIHRYLLIAKKA